MGSFVRQHRLAGDIAHGKNMGETGAALFIHPDKPFLIRLDADLLEPQAAALRAAADRRQNLVEQPVSGVAVLIPDRHLHAVFLRLDVGDRCLKLDILEQGLEALMQKSHEVPVHAGQQIRRHFHQAHPGPQAGIHASQLQTDIPPADHEQPVRDSG